MDQIGRQRQEERQEERAKAEGSWDLRKFGRRRETEDLALEKFERESDQGSGKI